jgi:hypothetical protein
MSEEENFDELNKLRYNLLVEKFEQYFKIKGYLPKDNFSNNVFFLSKDPTFQSMNNNETPNPNFKQNNKMIDILKELNETKSLKKLSINTGEFINKISKVINDANASILLTDESIKKNQSAEKILKIDEILMILNLHIEGKSKGDFYSILHSRIHSLNNFPSGPYKISLGINTNFNEEDDDLNESEKRNLNQNLSDGVFNLFKEENLVCENLINIKENTDSITFRYNPNSNDDINNFPDYKFSILNKDSKNYLVDRRYSGTTFSNLRLKIRGSQNVYESENEYLLYIFISLFDELCDLNKTTISKNIIFKMKNDNEERTAGIELNLELDNLTRIGILNRIKELNQITIDNKMKNQILIDEILTDYFPEMKDSVTHILSKNDEYRDSCCNCEIF